MPNADRKLGGRALSRQASSSTPWISEETGPEATIEALMSVVAYFQIPIDHAQHILRKTEHAVSQWRTQGRALGMTNGELDAFSDAFEHPQRNAARQAG